MRFNSCLLLLLSFHLGAYPVGDAVKMDHFGYKPLSKKIAYFSSNPGTLIELRNATNEGVALRITAVTDAGPDASKPRVHGDHIWQVDFSALSAKGRYHLASPALKIQSYDFDIREDVYVAPMAAALKALYYQRCGTAKPEAFGGVWHDERACHMADRHCRAICPGSSDYGELDLSGGWHDAGDYEKKIGFFKDCQGDDSGDQGETLWYLLTAYEANPGLFPDGQSRLPESGNGIPDILDEAKWELDWYLKMQRPDGHVLAGVRVRDLGKFKTPPSADDNPRLYSPPTPKTECIFVADIAHAARIFSAFTATRDYASRLKEAAEKTWRLQVSIAKADEYQFWAASEWLRLNPSDASARKTVESFKKWPTYWMNFFNVTDYGVYNYLQTPGADPAIAAGMRTDLGVRVEDAFKTNDSYNSGMRDWYYSNGSNHAKLAHGAALWWSAKLGGTGGRSKAETLAQAENYLHYLNGANPMNMTYMSNTESMGAKHCIWYPWSMWFQGPLYSGKPTSADDPLFPYTTASPSSRFGPPPGYVVSGSNNAYSGKSSPPLGANGQKPPMAKVYRDYFDGMGKAWEMNELGIYFTSAYIMLASLLSAH